MNILCYALPCFLKNGESYNYTINQLKILFNYCEIQNSNSIIIKENILSAQHLSNVINHIPKIESLDFSLSNLMPVDNFIKNNNIDIYHCFHNGFSLYNNFDCHNISTIYTTLPLNNSSDLDANYSKLYKDRIINTFNCSESIIVPYNFMKNDLCSFFNTNGSNIQVIPPFMPFDLIEKSKPISLSYIRSKFNIYGDYYLYIGEINQRNTLLDTIKLFKYYCSNSECSLVLSLSFIPKNKVLYYDLVSFIDRIGLSSKVIFLNNLTSEDFINLINSSLCFINLNNFSELNVTTIYALFLNTKILTYQSHSNLEFLEDYPIYISDYSSGYNIDFSSNKVIDNYIDKDDLFYIRDKFRKDFVLDKFSNIYNSIINKRGNV